MSLISFCPFYLSAGKPVYSCEEGTYLGGNGNCDKCYQECYKCSNNTLCRYCPSGCLNCDNTCGSISRCTSDDCSYCPDGYCLVNTSMNSNFKDYCNTCQNPGCKCAAYAWECDECRPGRYDISSKCNGSCIDNCQKCSDSNSCDVCNDGNYGQYCQYICSSHCKSKACEKDSGWCTNGYEDGYFRNGKDCEDCPENCTTCENTCCT